MWLTYGRTWVPISKDSSANDMPVSLAGRLDLCGFVVGSCRKPMSSRLDDAQGGFTQFRKSTTLGV